MEKESERSSREARAGIPPDLQRAMEEEAKTRRINVAQDCVDGIFYTGVRVGEQSFLITSKREVMSFEDAERAGLRLSSKEVTASRFSVNGITEFLEGRRRVDPAGLYRKIEAYIRRFVRLNSDAEYALLALWTMGTYIFKLFRHFPYIHLFGEKGSGKSLIMEVLQPVCFNGSMTANTTPAVIYRGIQLHSPSMFLDEMEQVRIQDRETRGAIMSVLNTGFMSMGYVERCEGEKHEVVRYPTYSPKMIASINDLDEVLRDRAIRIRMVRKLEEEKVEDYTTRKEVLDLQSDLRDELYRFALDWGVQLGRIYDEHRDKIPGLEGLHNRQIDLWSPIMLLGGLVDEASRKTDSPTNLTHILSGLATSKAQERLRDDSQDNETVKALSVTERMLEELTPLKEEGGKKVYLTDEVLRYFQRQDEFSWLQSKPWLSRLLSGRLDVEIKKQHVDGTTKKVYVVDVDRVEELAKRYGLESEV